MRFSRHDGRLLDSGVTYTRPGTPLQLENGPENILAKAQRYEMIQGIGSARRITAVVFAHGS